MPTIIEIINALRDAEVDVNEEATIVQLSKTIIRSIFGKYSEAKPQSKHYRWNRW